MRQFVIAALPEIFLLCGLFTGVMVGLFRKGKNNQLFGVWLVMGLLAVSAGLCFFQFESPKNVLFSGLFISNAFTATIKIIIMFFSILCLFLALDWLENSSAAGYEYPLGFGFVVAGLCIALSAGNLFMLFVAAEFISVSLYWLISYKKEDESALKSTLNFFIISFIGSAFLAFGCALLYGFSGSLSFSALNAVILKEYDNTLGINIGLVFFLCGMLLKIGAAPFHSWTPEVYQGSSAPVTALLVTVVQLALLCILFRLLLYPFFSLSGVWSRIIELAALLSLIWGSIGALRQDNIKRFVAYSTLAGCGYTLIAVASANPNALKEMLFYLIIYSLMTIGLFGVTSSLRTRGNLCETISKLSGLGQKEPGKALALTLILLSLAGLPPLAGFLGKFGIIMMALESQKYVLSLFALLSCITAAYYYLRIIKIMYFNEPGESFDSFTLPSAIVMKFCAFAAIFLTLYPSVLMKVCEQASLIIGIR